ncbi:MAG: hypothetical protein Q8M03_00365 [Legionella sp.]|nr:hypothetical protein [Legionella sp.]
MTSYILFILFLALTRAVFLLINNMQAAPVNLRPTPVEELPFPKHKLYELSEELKNIDAESHYMALWQQLSSLSNQQDLFSKVNSPLKNHRILVDNKGIISIDKQKVFVTYTNDEKLTIAIAIYQFAYAISIKSLNANSERLIRQGIVPLLMRPFSHLYGNFPVKQAEWELRQLTYSNYRKVTSPQKKLTLDEREAHSFQLFRCYIRKERFNIQHREGRIKPEESSASLHESILNPQHQAVSGLL